MEDKRPISIIGHEKEIVHENLELIQDITGMSNSEMAQILGVDKKYYEKIKKNGGPLDYERLHRLYHNLNVDLNRLIINDPRYDIVRNAKDVSQKDKVDYKVLLNNLIIEIASNENYSERVEMVLHTYLKFGEYLKKILTSKNDVIANED